MSMLFEPFSFNGFSVKNRFVRSATQDWLGKEDGTVSDREIELYELLAKNNVGLIITAHAYVQHPAGKASVRQNAIYADSFIDGYRKISAAVHKHGAKVILQISHAGRQTTPDITGGFVPIAPSAVTDGSTGITPREMTEDDIRDIIRCFADAISRAKAAGCDGVQLHIAHGYLLSQFISPYTNRRTDMWGGSIENRARIIKEIILAGHKLTGSDYPIFAKLNSTDGFDGPEYLTPSDTIYIAKLLKDLGIVAVEVSGGIREAKNVMSRPGIIRQDQEACFAEAARAIRAETGIPVILVGGLRSLAVMEDVITTGTADMVSLCRPFIKEPDLVLRLQQGQPRAGCISCNACFNPEGLACRYK